MRTKFRLLFLPLRWEFGCQQICMTLSRERERRARRTLELWDSSSTARKVVENRKSSSACARRSQSQGEMRNFFRFSWKLQNDILKSLLYCGDAFWCIQWKTRLTFIFSEKVEKLKRGKIETSRPVSANALFSLFLFSAKYHNELEVVSSVVFTSACVRSGECPFFLSFERKKPKVP